ncbi:MAG TPA: hypothetical protein VGJ81_09715 [Thermoanaerobaculia bacterium]
MKTLRATSAAIVLVVLSLFAVPAAFGSDHADPLVVEEPEANITDLFFFPHGDNYVLIFNVRRATLKGKPFPITPYAYAINIDLHSQVTFDNPGDKARYGGTIVNPGGIKPDVVFSIALNNDLTLSKKDVTGLQHPELIHWYSGLRDDPFIFPRFFGKNAISIVAEMPKSCFPAGQQDFLLWGVSTENGKQLDHDGRSSRTQQNRFNALNFLPPNEHVAEMMKEMTKQTKLQQELLHYKLTVPLANVTQLLVFLRKYDLAPDVMIYSNRFPCVFPNGRMLTDDVAAITCSTGDCILQELSFIEGGFPRATANDKPFLDTFPYEADPWPEKPEAPGPVSFWHIGFWILIVVLLLVFLWTWLFYYLGRRSVFREQAIQV